MKIEIMSCVGAVLFAHDCADNTMRITCESAISSDVSLSGANLSDAYLSGANLSGANLSDAYLSGAYLCGANLSGANLRGAYLGGANLRGADLSGAYLRDANLSGANLRGAYLSGAYLSGAYLRDANLRGAKLIGNRPVFQIGPIGSRADYLVAFLTDAGIRIGAGCFNGTIAEFVAAVAETHGDSVHGAEYTAAIAMIEAHAKLWMPQVANPIEPEPQ